MAFGAPATAFDAPGPNPPRTDERLTAFTFLTICPDVGRTRRLSPVLAVRWGHELVAGRATPVPLEVIPLSEWDRLAPVLRARFPSWEFLPAPAPWRHASCGSSFGLPFSFTARK